MTFSIVQARWRGAEWCYDGMGPNGRVRLERHFVLRACVRCSLPLEDHFAICPACRAPQPAPASAVVFERGMAVQRPEARYVLDRLLGEGAMGVVWRAWMFHDPTSVRGADAPELVALKFLRERGLGSTPGQTDSLRTFFRNEAEAMRRVDHPNVVRFVDLFEDRGTLCLAMEYVDGDTFEQILARHQARAKLAGPMALPGVPFQRTWYYFEQLLGALAATHALGIVHRDVKPSNVLVRKDGIVKLTDYGIAHLSRRTKYIGPPQPGTELVPGTGPYMSPEQVTGAPLDGRSDLYSAAIVLYEMLTGRTPFDTEGKTEWMIRLDHVEAQPLPLRALLPQAPPALDMIIARALAKDPAHRFGTAVELGETVRKALNLPDSPEWRAQSDFAREAARFRGHTAKLGDFSHSVGTLREIIVKKYRTMPLTIAK